MNVTEVAAGLPVAENVMVLVVGPPVRLIVKLAGWPAVTVTAVGGPEMLKSTPVPVSGTACGLVAALSAMLSEALFLGPVEVGRNDGIIPNAHAGALGPGGRRGKVHAEETTAPCVDATGTERTRRRRPSGRRHQSEFARVGAGQCDACDVERRCTGVGQLYVRRGARRADVLAEGCAGGRQGRCRRRAVA